VWKKDEIDGIIFACLPRPGRIDYGFMLREQLFGRIAALLKIRGMLYSKATCVEGDEMLESNTWCLVTSYPIAAHVEPLRNMICVEQLILRLSKAKQLNPMHR
jgi:hypothetical protein